MNKRKLMLVAVSLCMVAILGFGGTLAYLTDTDQQKNVFTTGKVQLDLDEVIVDKQEDDPNADNYGDFIPVTDEEGNELRTTDAQPLQEYKKVFPGNVIAKDPTVTVLEDSEDAWVIIKVDITGNDLYSLFGIEGSNELDLKKNNVFSGEMISEAVTAMEYHGEALSGYGNEKFFVHQQVLEDSWRLWFFMMEPMAETESVTLFNTVTIPENWNNTEMAAFDELSIDIKAYGVQADGFADAYEAMEAAFPTEAEF